MVIADGKVVGSALSLIVDYSKFSKPHTYQLVIGGKNFSSHNDKGDALYGIDIFISPQYRGLRLGRRLYDARKELCERLNLKAILFGGRIPNYSSYSDSLKPKEYIEKVKLLEIHDTVLTFQLNNDFHVRAILKSYLPGDAHSQEFAVLMEWNNIYFSPKNDTKSVVRLGLVQWQMRNFDNEKAFFDQVEFFVDAVSGYSADFCLFPELFNAPLMKDYNHLEESEAIRKLSSHTLSIKDKLQEFAISYNINIISGSMPLIEDGHLYNIGYLLRRDGSSERYEKIHITPNEVSYWGMKGGDKIKTFDTDCGKIGILICYDVEFPELGRILAQDGMNILFVPFLTDTQNGFTRVQRCAQARAIENECYVAIAGSVGNLPKVNNMDIQFAQSAVFTPSDFAFPTNGTKAEATANAEMTLIADCDLDLLKQLHNYGAVKNLKDRRTDLYQVSLKS
ncbi:MAG: bifunctional GNAT family N-acetyltransferase/carbon-nitrogen hydrolase family protein [Candidatus Kapaibacteriales bacterium]